MGIDYSAKIIVGAQVKDFPTYSTIEALTEDTDYLVREYPLYYDGCGDYENPVGICYRESGDYSAEVFRWDPEKIAELSAKFTELTGLPARVFLATHGS